MPLKSLSKVYMVCGSAGLVGAARLLLEILVLFGMIAPSVVGWGQAGPVPSTTSGSALTANLRKVLWLLGALGHGAHDDLLCRQALISMSPFLGHPASGHRSRHPDLWEWDVGVVSL